MSKSKTQLRHELVDAQCHLLEEISTLILHVRQVIKVYHNVISVEGAFEENRRENTD